MIELRRTIFIKGIFLSCFFFVLSESLAYAHNPGIALLIVGAIPFAVSLCLGFIIGFYIVFDFLNNKRKNKLNKIWGYLISIAISCFIFLLMVGVSCMV